jgi:hypothetical protein
MVLGTARLATARRYAAPRVSRIPDTVRVSMDWRAALTNAPGNPSGVSEETMFPAKNPRVTGTPTALSVESANSDAVSNPVTTAAEVSIAFEAKETDATRMRVASVVNADSTVKVTVPALPRIPSVVNTVWVKNAVVPTLVGTSPASRVAVLDRATVTTAMRRPTPDSVATVTISAAARLTSKAFKVSVEVAWR